MQETMKLNWPIGEIQTYCAAELIKSLADFGSVMPDLLRPDTDIGLLVEYIPGAPITFIDMARQERELGAMIGSKVDLRTPNELERHSQKQVLAGAIRVFAKNAS